MPAAADLTPCLYPEGLVWAEGSREEETRPPSHTTAGARRYIGLVDFGAETWMTTSIQVFYSTTARMYAVHRFLLGS